MPSTRDRPRPDDARLGTYLRRLGSAQRAALDRLRDAIRSTARDAVEGMGYGIPVFRLDGKVVVYCAAWEQHVSLYPLTAAMRRVLAAEPTQYATAKGTIRFPLDARLPVGLVRRLVRARVGELHPRLAGTRARAAGRKKQVGSFRGTTGPRSARGIG